MWGNNAIGNAGPPTDPADPPTVRQTDLRPERQAGRHPGSSRTDGRTDTQADLIRVGIVVYPGVQEAAVLGLSDIFRFAGRVGRDREARPALDVLRIELSDQRPPPGPSLAVAILPPSLTAEPPAPVSDALRTWLLARHDEGTLLCSVCVGAFILGEVGLLSGRPATTHWALKDAFVARFADVQLDTDRLLIDDGDIMTAGGLMAWVDLSLKLIDRLLGPSVMLATARAFLVDPGGREQRFYASFAPVLTHGDAPILRVQRWLQTMVGEPVTVELMAEHARLSRRTFLRRFQKATGLKTSEYLQHLRVGRAREWLERTSMSQQEVAWAVGYEDVGAFQKVFVRLLGLTPTEYRRRFRLPEAQPITHAVLDG